MRSGFCNFMHIKTISPDVKKRLRERRRRFVLVYCFIKYLNFLFVDHVHVVILHQEKIVVVKVEKK